VRCLFSVHGYKPAWRVGGPVISVSSLAESLVRKGHEVTVFTTNANLDQDLDVPTDQPVEVDGVTVYYFRRIEPLKALFPRVAYLSRSIGTLYAPAMARALASQAGSFDVLHTHLPFVYPTLATARAAFRAQRPLFYHQRGVFDPERLKFRALKKTLYLTLVEKPILRRATTLIALTEAERESYAALGIGTPCRVIPNGIMLPARLDRERTRAVLASLRIGDDQRVILFMGRLHPIKGADRLLRAFVRVASAYPDALLVLAGPDEFGIERSFRAGVSDAGLADRVRFPGMVQGETKSALLERSDLFCLPSDAEGFSMAILEALAHETPVLISPRCHFPDVETFQAGRIAPVDDESLARALGEMLAQPERLVAMGQAGRALVAERYTWDAAASSMIAAYEEGIERNNRAHRGSARAAT
jgi:glycosyltransferase involved in cell wall biosynthesis